MIRHRPGSGRLSIVTGLGIAALAGAALALPGAAPRAPQPVPEPHETIRITCPTPTGEPAGIGSASRNAQCPWQYRMGVRRPMWP